MASRVLKFLIVFGNTKWIIVLYLVEVIHIFLFCFTSWIFFLYIFCIFPYISSNYFLVIKIILIIIWNIELGYQLLLFTFCLQRQQSLHRFSRILRVPASLEFLCGLWRHGLSQFVKILSGSWLGVGWLVGAFFTCSCENKALGNMFKEIWTSQAYNSMFCLFVLPLKAFRWDLYALEICFVLFRTILINLWAINPAPDQIYLLWPVS